MDLEKRERIRQKRELKRKKKQKMVFTLIILVVILLLIGVSIAFKLKEKDSGSQGNTAQIEMMPKEPQESQPPEDEPQAPPESAPQKETLNLTEAQKYTGDLILVNSLNLYRFDENAEALQLTNVGAYEGGAVPVADEQMELSGRIMGPLYQMIQGCNQALSVQDTGVTSAYRTLESQQRIYEEYVRDYGEAYAKAYVANPGYSEHHTGLALDMGIYYPAGGEGSFSQSNNATWMDEHCQEYGFVRRYREDKVSVTGISNEAWHFRYVGIPHAVYMNSNNLCLEEYIDFIRSSTNKDAPIGVESGGVTYEIYGTRESTIEKPEGEYTISGDNIDGYIITQIRQ